MSESQLFSAELTFNNVEGNSKKKALETLSKKIATVVPSFDANELFDNFIARERISSTGLGEGVAIPHCRLDGCTKITCALAKLATPVDFDADDGQAVDLITVIIVPATETQAHLDTLKAIVSLFDQSSFRQALRDSKDTASLFKVAEQFTAIKD